MGGGDKLFEKIDTGIRAAKVIICCVSEKYAKSPNCNREVTKITLKHYNESIICNVLKRDCTFEIITLTKAVNNDYIL